MKVNYDERSQWASMLLLTVSIITESPLATIAAAAGLILELSALQHTAVKLARRQVAAASLVGERVDAGVAVNVELANAGRTCLGAIYLLISALAVVDYLVVNAICPQLGVVHYVLLAGYLTISAAILHLIIVHRLTVFINEN